MQEQFDQMVAESPDLKIKSLQIFRSEDELDMEGIKVTLTNGTVSPDSLGVSVDSDYHTTIDLTDKQVKSISIQKAVQFKAPVGLKVKIAKGPSLDVVSEIFSEEPEGTFEDIKYFKLEEG